MIGLVLLLSGFTLINKNKSISTKSVEKVSVVKKTIIKKPIIKKKEKKVFKYKFCSKHIKIMTHASKYITEEFDKGYFNQKDFVGAKAQLFLIQSKSQSIFAKNINNAMKSYNTQYNLARKNRCNLNKFQTTPLKKVENKINTLKKASLKKEIKK